MRIRKDSKWWHRHDKIVVTVRGASCGYVSYDFDGRGIGETSTRAYFEANYEPWPTAKQHDKKRQNTMR